MSDKGSPSAIVREDGWYLDVDSDMAWKGRKGVWLGDKHRRPKKGPK